jgi:hypothetical protein
VSLSPNELLGRLVRIHEIFSKILENRALYDKMSQDKKTQLSTGINKSYGQAEAFLVEYMAVLRAENKGRPVITQTHADVTSGAADALFAKSIECKSVTAPTRGDVLTQIRKAIEQLAGNTGSMPRDGDVRVIEVVINSRDNPWPDAGGHYGKGRPMQSEDELTRKALDDFKALLSENRDGANKLRLWITSDLVGGTAPSQPLRNFNFPSGGPAPLVHAGSTRPLVAVQTGPTTVQLHKVRCVALKVKFDPAYTTTVTWAGGEEVTEISMQAYRSAMGAIEYKVVKVKKNVFTFDPGSGGYVNNPVRVFK